MDEDSVIQYILDAFESVDTVVADDNHFFFYNPADLPPDHRFPFATLMTNDENDDFSNLNRPGIFRLNVGVSKQTFRDLFAAVAADSGQEPELASQFDFTKLDVLMPHPVYGSMYWVCVLNPGEETLDVVRRLLAEAYEQAKKRRTR